MTVYRLHLQTPRRGVAELHLGWKWRVFFLAVTAVIVLVLLQVGRIGGLLPVVGVATLIAGLYQEQWTFDRNADVVESQVGLVFLARTRRYRLSDVQVLRVRTRGQADPSRRGSGGSGRPSVRIPMAIQRGYVQLILEVSDSDESDKPQAVIVETESIRNRKRVDDLAEALGRALDIPVASRFG